MCPQPYGLHTIRLHRHHLYKKKNHLSLYSRSRCYLENFSTLIAHGLWPLLVSSHPIKLFISNRFGYAVILYITLFRSPVQYIIEYYMSVCCCLCVLCSVHRIVWMAYTHSSGSSFKMPSVFFFIGYVWMRKSSGHLKHFLTLPVSVFNFFFFVLLRTLHFVCIVTFSMCGVRVVSCILWLRGICVFFI